MLTAGPRRNRGSLAAPGTGARLPSAIGAPWARRGAEVVGSRPVPARNSKFGGCRNASSPATWFALMCAIAMLAEWLGADLAFHRSRVADGQWWRLFGAYLAHWSLLHFLANVGTLLILGLLAGALQPRLVWLAAGAATCSVVLWHGMPEIAHYRGSSPLVAMFMPAALLALSRRPRGGKLLASILACAFAARIGFDAAGMIGSPLLPEGVRSTWELHIAGAAAGVAALAAHLLVGPQRSRSSKPSS